MTEQEWSECVEPRTLLDFLTDLAYGRKLTLFISACCFRGSHQCSEHPAGQRAPTYATDFAERLVDGYASLDEVEEIDNSLCYAPDYEQAAVAAAVETRKGVPPPDWPRCSMWDWPERLRPAEVAVESVVKIAGTEARYAAGKDYDARHMSGPDLRAAVERVSAVEEAAVGEEKRALCHLLRDIVGNPFRPIHVDPAWRTPAVAARAEATYSNRQPTGELAPAALQALADALQDAGCSAPAVVGHLREPGPHARGCHALDLILGRA
jgi:hypothetical protein